MRLPAEMALPDILRGTSTRPLTVAVMQPYFFPYGGYFALIQAVDLFVLDDLAQYTPKRWMNRNRIRRPPAPDGDAWQYLTLPVQRSPAGTPICKIPLAPLPWQQLLRGKLTVYAGAPYDAPVMELFTRWAELVSRLPQQTLAEANALGLQLVCSRLGLTTPLVRLSVLRPYLPDYNPPYPKGENPLAICRALGNVTEYRNLPGGAAFYPRPPYRDAGIRLRFQQWNGTQEVPLSVLDLLMYHPPGAVRQQLRQIQLFD